MTIEEFKTLCKSYIPDCQFKDADTCGLCCYTNGDFDFHKIVVALLPRGEFAVYDQWRDVTITGDLKYVTDWLKHVSGK